MSGEDRRTLAQAQAEDSDELERYDLTDDDGVSDDETPDSFFSKLMGY